MSLAPSNPSLFFFNDTATTEIYTLSLHDALPISGGGVSQRRGHSRAHRAGSLRGGPARADCGASPRRQGHQLWNYLRTFPLDRKSTRLNSSHGYISYAVFCLKEKQPSITDASPLF